MTQRSILSGLNPTVIIKAGADVTVRGVEGDRVSAETQDSWGMKVERKHDAIEIRMGGSGEVLAPVGSNLKIYAGRNIEIQGGHGEAAAYAGLHLTLREIGQLVHASAGGTVEIDCAGVVGKEIKLNAGRDVRLYVREMDSALVRVNDLGGYWEGRIGDGKQVRLTIKAGGDVTLVTNREVVAQPPDFVLGKIERPG